MTLSFVEFSPVLVGVVEPREPAVMPLAKAATRRPNVPASFFGIVLGLAGLGNAWRGGAAAWHLPAAVSEGLMAVATIAP